MEYTTHRNVRFEKIQDVEKSVRTSMRLLSRLHLKFRETLTDSEDAVDMLKFENLRHLIKAILEISAKVMATMNKRD